MAAAGTGRAPDNASDSVTDCAVGLYACCRGMHTCCVYILTLRVVLGRNPAGRPQTARVLDFFRHGHSVLLPITGHTDRSQPKLGFVPVGTGGGACRFAGFRGAGGGGGFRAIEAVTSDGGGDVTCSATADGCCGTIGGELYPVDGCARF